MDSWMMLLLQGTIGGTLGLFYFGGLWWTVQKMQDMPGPWLWAGVSFLVRAAIVMAGFALLAAEHWSSLIAALLGFFTARSVLIYRYRPLLDLKNVG